MSVIVGCNKWLSRPACTVGIKASASADRVPKFISSVKPCRDWRWWVTATDVRPAIFGCNNKFSRKFLEIKLRQLLSWRCKSCLRSSSYMFTLASPIFYQQTLFEEGYCCSNNDQQPRWQLFKKMILCCCRSISKIHMSVWELVAFFPSLISQ